MGIRETRVFILYTGGTIGMAPKDADNPYSPLEPKGLSRLLEYAPGFDRDKGERSYRSQQARALARAAASDSAQEPFLELDSGNIIRFGSGSFETPVDSSDVGPADWQRMAHMIEEQYEEYDGFVILHGTDTMAFTSSALSFMCQNLAKPIVITGSQLPISGVRTDAILNLVNAIYIAGYKATDLPLIPEVIIAFADKIIRGCRASKVSTSDWAGFDSPNFPLLGTIGEHIKINTNYVRSEPKQKFYVQTDFDEHVFNLTLFPGFSNVQIRKLMTDPHIRGVVLRTYGTGNVPGNEDFLETVRQAVEAGKLVVNLSQCVVGTVEMGLYEASSGLMERGVISGLDMTPEAALTKMMWVLCTQFSTGKDYAQMQINQRGEQTDNLFDLRFGGVPADKPLPVYTSAVTPDHRLDRDRISNAMLRVSNVQFEGLDVGEEVWLRIYMNMPTADADTPLSEERHVASLGFEWVGVPESRMQNITYQTQTVISQGDIILTLLTDRPHVRFSCDGVFIALYAKA